MRTNKKYTNATFTKRVDHEAGRHRPTRAAREPIICSDCGAVYVRRRWTKSGSAIKDNHPDPISVCPACKQNREGEPRGFVFLDGAFVRLHEQEIEKLLRNEVERASEENPMARIIEWKKGDKHQLTVTTTTEHLAQRLGHALEKAFGGKVQYDFSHENKLARVSWQRDE